MTCSAFVQWVEQLPLQYFDRLYVEKMYREIHNCMISFLATLLHFSIPSL